ncbi:MAG: hypothetical protein FWE92_00055 [Defluviitaleaceae bacterium]|nr:hypothetical protein [Defluviitaleaceae bacterium]
MSVRKIIGIIESYGNIPVQSASAQLESGLAEVMAAATENFGLEDSIPHEITVTPNGHAVDVSLSVQGAWRRDLHENPRFRGYKFLERAWLEHRERIIRNAEIGMRN